MIVPAQHYHDVHLACKKDSAASEDQAILCFVACGDADSVCASQQLLSLLNKESIHFSLVPVTCYEEIRDHCQSLTTAEEMKTVMLLNCGATDDVRSLCRLPSNIRIVILDHHRPVWHGHNNDEDHDTLVLVDNDDPVPKSAVPAFNEQLDNEVAESEEEEEDDIDSDDEDEDSQGEDDDGLGPGRKRRRIGADGAPRPSPAARAAARTAAATARKKRLEEVDAYYNECNGYGKPSSVLVYELCRRLQQDDNFHLWCAIVGLTEQVLFQQISKAQYNTWRDKLATYVTVQQDGEGGDGDEGQGISLPKHMVQLETCEDLRLTLLRHWTIEESLRYTGYVAARLQTWRQKGVENLRSLLTYMCIPLKHATTPYRGLRQVYNNQLRSQLPRFAPKHMLSWDSLHINSFRLRFMHEEVGAFDMVFALLGLLTDPQLGSDPASHRKAFGRAADAMHVRRNLHMVNEGIEAAKQMCQDVVHECGLMITAGKIHGGKTSDYRYVNLQESNAVANVRFRHPTVLKYLALFMRDATSYRYTGDARRPMVVAGPPDERGICCVVAMHAKQLSGNKLQNNPFARPFLEAAQALNIVQVHSDFDNVTYYIRKEEVDSFLTKLVEVVEDYRKAAEQQEVGS